MPDIPSSPDQNSSQQKVQTPGSVNPDPAKAASNPQLEHAKKTWGTFAPLAPGSRGAIPSSSTLSKRLTSMQRKPLPPLRTPRPR